MSLEQPQNSPGIDELLEKARQEAGAKKSPEATTEVDKTVPPSGMEDLIGSVKEETRDVPAPENSVEKAPEESFDDFLAKTEKETESVKIEKAKSEAEKERIQKEKELKAFETLKPDIDQLVEILSENKVDNGKQSYFILKNDVEGYRKALIEDSRRRYQASALYEEINRKYEDATGKEFYVSSVPFQFHDQRYSYVDGGYDDLKGMSEEEYVKSHSWAFSKSNPPEDLIRGRRTEFSEGSGGSHNIKEWSLSERHGNMPITDPEQYVAELRRVRDYRNTEEYQGKMTPEKAQMSKEIHDSVYAYHQKAQGLALGALETGDVISAAEALAFAESVQKMSARIMQQVKERLSVLSPIQKKEFVTKFESEKSKYKTVEAKA